MEVPKLERYLPILLSICYVAPLIGLLGTVLGLIGTFTKMKTGNGFATPADLSEGVYESLVTSATGLAVAIAAFLLYSYLAAYVKSLIHDMERAGIEIVNILHDARTAAAAVVAPAESSQIIAFAREAADGTTGRRGR
jgi:biopolymer transport protein ExbB